MRRSNQNENSGTEALSAAAAPSRHPSTVVFYVNSRYQDQKSHLEYYMQCGAWAYEFAQLGFNIVILSKDEGILCLDWLFKSHDGLHRIYDKPVTVSSVDKFDPSQVEIARFFQIASVPLEPAEVSQILAHAPHVKNALLYSEGREQTFLTAFHKERNFIGVAFEPFKEVEPKIPAPDLEFKAPLEALLKSTPYTYLAFNENVRVVDMDLVSQQLPGPHVYCPRTHVDQCFRSRDPSTRLVIVVAHDRSDWIGFSMAENLGPGSVLVRLDESTDSGFVGEGIHAPVDIEAEAIASRFKKDWIIKQARKDDWLGKKAYSPATMISMMEEGVTFVIVCSPHHFSHVQHHRLVAKACGPVWVCGPDTATMAFGEGKAVFYQQSSQDLTFVNSFMSAAREMIGQVELGVRVSWELLAIVCRLLGSDNPGGRFSGHTLRALLMSLPDCYKRLGDVGERIVEKASEGAARRLLALTDSLPTLFAQGSPTLFSSPKGIQAAAAPWAELTTEMSHKFENNRY